MLWFAFLMTTPSEEGLGSGPSDPIKFLTALYGPPCDCKGGTSYSGAVSSLTKHGRTVDCGDRTIFLRS